MAKRGYKLQEFVAHSGNVNCLNIGKKTCKLFVSGGDDHKVNLWSIGEPKSLTSLCGHTTPIESVTFDSSEVLVVAGCSAGVIKLWDLEETTMVRTLTGHRSYCTAVQFHPFGEFFASGSMDSNLKIWDIRKKGCIHTYKGHTRGISTIRFSPDGRWVISGGLDNVVKVWDLTAGKLLHDFKSHEGHIRSIEFHPLEFLLATGSADKTVKFWDLETFELIGSARAEATGVRSLTFHPDGRTLFCGFDDSLKVYSWEPVICHDAVDMGWSTLGELRVHDGKILGCSHNQDSIGVWVADISLIEPYGGGIIQEQISHPEPAYDLHKNPLEKVESHRISKSTLRSVSPNSESGEIKNIYVDTAGGSPVVSKKDGSLSSPKVVVPSDSKEVKNLLPQKPGRAVNLQVVVPSDAKEVKHLPPQKPGLAVNLQVVVPSDAKEVKKLPPQKPGPAVNLRARSIGRSNNTSFVVPNVVPRDSPGSKDLAKSRRESLTATRVSTGISQKPPHVRRPSATKFDMKSSLDTAMDLNLHKRVVSDDGARESSEEKQSNINSVTQKFEKVLSPRTPSKPENGDETTKSSKGISSVKCVNGVAVVQGRTRTLVERFEKREKLPSDEVKTPDTAPQMVSETAKASPLPVVLSPQMVSETAKTSPLPVVLSPQMVSETAKTSPLLDRHPQTSGRESTSNNENDIEDLMQNHDVLLSTFRSRLTRLQVVRHFWERNDIKGAVNAMRKLPDHSVQADVISILMDKMEILNLDLFSFLLPVLLSLLDSKIERHTNISLEMLLKLVAVFGPVVRSTVSAPPAVGVDLQAEQRRECCNQCFVELQKIQNILPALVRRGGLVAKCALELNLVLQQS